MMTTPSATEDDHHLADKPSKKKKTQTKWRANLTREITMLRFI